MRKLALYDDSSRAAIVKTLMRAILVVNIPMLFCCCLRFLCCKPKSHALARRSKIDEGGCGVFPPTRPKTVGELILSLFTYRLTLNSTSPFLSFHSSEAEMSTVWVSGRVMQKEPQHIRFLRPWGVERVKKNDFSVAFALILDCFPLAQRKTRKNTRREGDCL